MTLVDLLVIVVVVLAGLGGWRRGLTGVLPALVGLLVGLAVGSWLAGIVVPDAAATTVRVLVLLAVVAVGGLLGATLGGRVGAVAAVAVRRLHLRPLDRAAGALVRAGGALVVCWLLAGVLGGVLPATTTYASDSRVLGLVDGRLPARDALVSRAGEALGVPADLLALVPTAAVDGLDPAQVGETTAAVGRSVVKITGTGCGTGAEGSGFVVEGGLVVTNAHVVDGLARFVVRAQDGLHAARPVVVDDAADLAVLRVDGLTLPALTLADDAVPNGTRGVVLGYPGDGELTAVPATVVQRLPVVQPGASGGLSAREVYRLDSVVRAGNSGGPLVGTDGSVLGVVNARSATDDDTGFALTLAPLRDALARAADATATASTGGCAA